MNYFKPYQNGTLPELGKQFCYWFKDPVLKHYNKTGRNRCRSAESDPVFVLIGSIVFFSLSASSNRANQRSSKIRSKSTNQVSVAENVEEEIHDHGTNENVPEDNYFGTEESVPEDNYFGAEEEVPTEEDVNDFVTEEAADNEYEEVIEEYIFE